MKSVLNQAARLVAGSFIVYVVFAACSAAGTPKLQISAEDDPSEGDPRARDGGAPSDGRDGGRPPASGESGSGSILDPIIDPVPTASADPTDGSRLKAIYRVSQDGAREPVAGLWWDSERSEECTWRKAADGVHRCLPNSIVPGGTALFADAACTQDAVIVPLAYCSNGQTPPRYVAGAVIECTSELRSRILQIGASTPSMYNRTTEGACVDLTTSYAPSYAFYRATEVPAASFVGSTLEHD